MIDNYEKWIIAYTKALRLPMMFYTTAIQETLKRQNKAFDALDKARLSGEQKDIVV